MTEVRFTHYETQPPKLNRVLLVDDNDRYVSALTEHLEKSGVEVFRVETARDGVKAILSDGENFDGIVTDISMEGQLSGLKVLSAAKKSGFSGILTVATTGLDTWFGFFFNRVFFGKLMKCDYLIPKRPIKKSGKIIWIKSNSKATLQ
ncbi:MAG: response regulator [Candidatus Electryonea clarkiae]|nr:response regulator [Candidatus Electryonea clarkiae]MDP8288010.1 response regulator [Candidatus Electryonea clarkiae]